MAIFRAIAENLRGRPMINEWRPGEWVELYNPGDEAYDLTGHRLEAWSADIDVETEPETGMKLPAEELPAGGLLVVDISELGSFEGEIPRLRFTDDRGRAVDVFFGDRALADGTPGEGRVYRRNGDGGPFCTEPSEDITRGEPNPPFMERGRCY
jgi:hypothetical protein